MKDMKLPLNFLKKKLLWESLQTQAFLGSLHQLSPCAALKGEIARASQKPWPLSVCQFICCLRKLRLQHSYCGCSVNMRWLRCPKFCFNIKIDDSFEHTTKHNMVYYYVGLSWAIRTASQERMEIGEVMEQNLAFAEVRRQECPDFWTFG